MSKNKKQTVTYCEVCRKNIHGGDFKMHCKGKKHKHKLHISEKRLKKQKIINQSKACPVKAINHSAQSTLIMISDSRKRRRKWVDSMETPEISITGRSKAEWKEDILHYFSKLGTIKIAHVDWKVPCMSLQYEHIQEADTVMRMEHNINDEILLVEWLKGKPFTTIPKKSHCELEMLQQLENLSFLDSQINWLIERNTPDLSCIQSSYHKVKCDIAGVMDQHFLSCMVFTFGSAVTSLRFLKSNLDIFVDTGNDADCVQKAKVALSKSPLFYSVSNSISHQIEYVFCKHARTKITCSLNFHTTSILGVKNSELIKYYVSLDTKVRPFMLVIKYWAKMHSIKYKKYNFSTYPLIMMCIFYLQQKHSFPSVHSLQTGTCPTDSRIVWNMNFVQKSTIDVNTSLRSLLQGFFSFYSNFNYDSIISPYMGVPIEKSLFLNESTIPDEFYLYKKNLSTFQPLQVDTPLCLQDPFAHNINTCKLIDQNFLQKFVTLCGSAHSKFSQNDENYLLYSIFYEHEIRDPRNSYYVCIQRKVTNTTSEEHDSILLWFQRVKHYLNTVFEKIFKFNMIMVGNTETSTLYRATCSLDTWSNRDVYANKIKLCRTILGREILVTDFLCSSFINEIRNIKLFECNIHVSCHEDPSRVFVRFDLIKKGGYDEHIWSFLKSFKSVVGSWFEIYERELDEVF